MSDLIITPNIGGAIVTAADAAKARRDELLTLAATVTTVTDRLDADDATNTLRQLSEFAKHIESQREQAQAPVLVLQRGIQALAKELTATITAEATRISRVLGEFEAAERTKAEDERRKAQAETARIAEETRKKAIEASKAASNSLMAARAVDEVMAKGAEQIACVKQQAAAIVPPKAEGSKLRGTICFEVEDIKAVYTEYPELVVLEPNGAAIRAILKTNPNLQIPGLRHWVEKKLSV